jgi:hypothetical protein
MKVSTCNTPPRHSSTWDARAGAHTRRVGRGVLGMLACQAWYQTHCARLASLMVVGVWWRSCQETRLVPLHHSRRHRLPPPSPHLVTALHVFVLLQLPRRVTCPFTSQQKVPAACQA